jgi:hypothetical protein
MIRGPVLLTSQPIRSTLVEESTCTSRQVWSKLLRDLAQGVFVPSPSCDYRKKVYILNTISINGTGGRHMRRCAKTLKGATS